jgi:hypothetical protein
MNRGFGFKAIVRVLLVLLVFCLGLCSYAKWQAYHARKDAEVLIVELRSLRVRESTLDDVKEIAAHHVRYHYSMLGNTPVCHDTDEVCYFDFSYENSLLARLRLASIVRFGVRIQVRQRRVDAIMMGLQCGVRPAFFGIDLIEGLQPFTEGTIEISNVREEITGVRLTPNAPERDRAYSLSLRCFDHIGRCHSKAELLPAMAKDVVAH